MCLAGLVIDQLRREITSYCDLADRVIDQTRRRVLLGEQVPSEQKVYSIFEPHTDLIKRGKVLKPVEFGHKVFLAESAQGLITDYRVLKGNPADSDHVEASLQRHQQTFQHPPEWYAGDRGFYSADNVQRCRDAAHGANWIPPTSTFANPPGSPVTESVYAFTDAGAVGSCAGGGSALAICRWGGSAWTAAGGRGAAAGSDGQMQVNSGGSFAAQGFGLSGGASRVSQRTTECATGTVSLSAGTWTYPGGTVAAAGSTSQDIPIITGLNGSMRYTHVLIAESTQFGSATVTNTKASLGRTGSSTNDEMLPQTSMMVSGGNAWFAEDRPQTPILGAPNTYTISLGIRTTGGNVSALTAGAVYYEVCGYAVQ
jgi:hypothetical protein